MPTAPNSSPVPVRLGDSLRSAVLGAGHDGAGHGFMQTMFSSQLALAAYRCSGMLRKVVRIPAHDRVREWRDWQADEKQIKALEDEETRLGIVAKVKQAEVLRGVGGGALILITAGDHGEPLPENIGTGALLAVNVVSRRQLTLVDIDRELTSPTYGMPAYFQVNGSAAEAKIHPSRVVCFRGDPFPDDLVGVSDEDRFWGDCRLEQVFREVQRADETQGWFAALVRKAKLLRIGIPNISDYTATSDGQAKLNSRVALIAQGESVLNATLYDAGNGADGAGEKITDYQITWAGIPAIMDAFDQRVAAVSNIPFTVLMGRSPAGMNATGDHDRQNWNREVVSGQKLELRPCLNQLDKALIPSAGVAVDKVTWRFAPLETPTEAEEATVFKTTMEAVEKLRADNSIPEVALNKAVQNLMSEREWLPGLDQALAEIPEAERFGLNPDDDGTDPSELQAGKEGDPDLAPGGEDGSQAARRRAANDAKPRTLYVSRKVQNVADIKAWARAQGLPDLDDDLHVTIAFSRTPVDWIKMGSAWADFSGKGSGDLIITAGGPRVVEPLGDRTAVLMFASSDLSWRNREMREAGASWDYDDFQPHISLTGDPVDLLNVEPYRGKIALGPEVFEEIQI